MEAAAACDKMEVGLVEMESLSLLVLGLLTAAEFEAPVVEPFCRGGGGRLVGPACVGWL